MAKTRREFSSEFKREAVALLGSIGRPLTRVASEVGISPSMLRNWRAVFSMNGDRSRVASIIQPLPSPADQASEIARLKRELDRTRMERDVLKNRLRPLPPVRRRNGLCYASAQEGSCRLLIGGTDSVKTWHMGRCALEIGDTAVAAIPVRKMMNLHAPRPPA